MNEQLTLKELAAYLPYGLKCECIDSELSNGWDSLSQYVKGYIFEMDNEDLDSDIVSHFKPILYPLYYLTKEIEYNGERFVPVKELFQMAYFSVYDDYYINPNYTMISAEYCALNAIEKHSNSTYNYGFSIELPYHFRFSVNGDFLTIPQFELYNKLFEWRFDIFNLIPRSLAIPITETFNPYK